MKVPGCISPGKSGTLEWRMVKGQVSNTWLVGSVQRRSSYCSRKGTNYEGGRTLLEDVYKSIDRGRIASLLSPIKIEQGLESPLFYGSKSSK